MNQKGKGNDEFCTPDYIFFQLNSIFKFELDAAASGDTVRPPPRPSSP